VNLPVEGIGILLAVDTIPDMFRTLANATGAMMLTIVAHAGADADQAGAPARTPP
jgi:Na+/H+-dicarboxylate symporter